MRKLSQEEVVRRIEALHPTLEVTGTYIDANTRIKVRCTKCGHTWKALPSSLFRHQGDVCRKCASKMPSDTATARLAEARANFPDISFPDTVRTVNEAFDARCTVCGHVWTTRLRNLLLTRGCPNCNRTPTSTTEQFLFETLRLALYPEKVRCRNRTAIGRELDIYIPGRAKAIEFGAWRWHKHTIEADIAKETLCEKAGIELLTIYDDAHDTGPKLPKRSLCLETRITSLEDLTTLGKQVLTFVEPNSEDRAQKLDWERIYETAKQRTDRKAILENFAAKMAEMHPDIEVRGRYIRSKTPIEVRCTVCGHVWKTTPGNLLRGSGCPECARLARLPALAAASQKSNSMAKASFEAKMAKVNPKITIIGTYTKNNEKLECSCSICGHHWMATPASLLSGSGCPKCANRKRGAAVAAAHAARRAAKATRNPNDSPQSGRGNTPDDSPGKETSCP